MERIKNENINTLPYWDDLHATRAPEESTRFELVVELIRRSGGKRVLDIGTGQGELYDYLTRRNVGTVFFGTDFSYAAIRRCREKYPAAEWGVADVYAQPFDDKHFDVVTSCEVLEHIEEPARLAREMMRLVKDDGAIILSTPFKNRIQSKEHVWEFVEQDIRDLFPDRKVQFARTFPSLIVAYITTP